MLKAVSGAGVEAMVEVSDGGADEFVELLLLL
jgi:hypothetical protein